MEKAMKVLKVCKSLWIRASAKWLKCKCKCKVRWESCVFSLFLLKIQTLTGNCFCCVGC
jgi:hypothetical protein